MQPNNFYSNARPHEVRVVQRVGAPIVHGSSSAVQQVFYPANPPIVPGSSVSRFVHQPIVVPSQSFVPYHVAQPGPTVVSQSFIPAGSVVSQRPSAIISSALPARPVVGLRVGGSVPQLVLPLGQQPVVLPPGHQVVSQRVVRRSGI